MEFFRSGAKYKERLFMAANRCSGPWTYIETDAGPRLALEVFRETGVGVRSWDGESVCDAVTSEGILKEIEPAFRVVLDNGQFFDCSRNHQILTDDGVWRDLGETLSLSSGLRWWQRREGFEANCVAGGYLCDEQPLSEAGSGQVSPLLPSDAPRPYHLIFSRKDVAAHIFQHIHECQRFAPLSTLDDRYRLSDLFLPFSAPFCYSDVLPLTSIHQGFLQLAAALTPVLQSKSEVVSRQFSLGDVDLSEFFSAEDKPVLNALLDQENQQSLEMSQSLQLSQELYCDTERIPIFFPCYHPPLLGGRKIKAVVPIGLQPIIDVSVDKIHNYFTAGVCHHNTGKSLAASYEVALHLTGYYPDWWTGYRFDRPTKWWASSETSMMTRDFMQRYLLGEWGRFGTGMIPRDCIIDWSQKRGIPEAVDICRIKSKFGESEVGFKSYEIGWRGFQGTARDGIWNDEECNLLVHNECLTRLMTTEGLYILTFTPLTGLTEVVLSYLGDSVEVVNNSPHSYVIQCSWDDVPHLSEAEKARQRARTPPHLLDAKSKGIPTIGSGAIYPVPESEIEIDPFKIPEWWPRCFALDVGWNRTAALWGALDRESDTLYLYSEYYRGQAEPSVHAEAIKARGKWIPGVIDPASIGSSQVDGRQIFTQYEDYGLDISKSKNAVEAGIYEVWQRLSTGRIKVFKNLKSWFKEFRMYRRDINGKIVKDNDHLMDCTKYLCLSGIERAITQSEARGSIGDVHGFQPVDSVTGY